MSTLMAVEATAASRFRDVFAAERIKLLSLRSTYVMAVAAFGSAVASVILIVARMNLSPFGRAAFDPVTDEFNTGVWSTLMLGAACAGAVAMTSEYGSGLIRTTFIAVPSRGRVILAKAAALTAVTGAVGAATAAATFAVSRTMLAAQGIDPPANGVTLARDLIAVLVALPVAALIGMAVGAVIRHPALATLTVVIVLAIVPSLVRTNGRGVQATLSNAMPYHAWCALVGQASDSGFPLQQPPTVALSWVWFVLWPALALVLAALVVRRRDV